MADDNLRRDRARELRRAQTESEKELRSRLKGGQLDGVKFRRQFPIGPFFADFCAPKEFLIVELDGSQHLDSVEQERQRSEYLAALGCRVVRLWDNDAFANTDEVVDQLSDLLKEPQPPRATRGGLTMPGRGAFRTRN